MQIYIFLRKYIINISLMISLLKFIDNFYTHSSPQAILFQNEHKEIINYAFSYESNIYTFCITGYSYESAVESLFKATNEENYFSHQPPAKV